MREVIGIGLQGSTRRLKESLDVVVLEARLAGFVAVKYRLALFVTFQQGGDFFFLDGGLFFFGVDVIGELGLDVVHMQLTAVRLSSENRIDECKSYSNLFSFHLCSPFGVI